MNIVDARSLITEVDVLSQCSKLIGAVYGCPSRKPKRLRPLMKRSARAACRVLARSWSLVMRWPKRSFLSKEVSTVRAFAIIASISC